MYLKAVETASDVVH